jgi:uncharacterized protein YdhG (YjbR/CyaY superfamily)
MKNTGIARRHVFLFRYARRMKKSETVEAYLADLPPRERDVLEKLRQTVRSVVPDAGEKIAYGIPTFTYHGNLVHYGAGKRYLSFYPGSRRVMKQFAEELRRWETTEGATIRFQPEKPLPATLVKKIVRARVAENLARKR